MSTFSNPSTSNRNNRKLQRTGNPSYKSRKKEFFGRNIQLSEKPLRDRYNFIDRTAPLWRRVTVMTLYLALVAVLLYALVNISAVDVELWLKK